MHVLAKLAISALLDVRENEYGTSPRHDFFETFTAILEIANS